LTGPRTHNNQYYGEAYDARMESSVADWKQVGFTPPHTHDEAGNTRSSWHSCALAAEAAVTVENVSG
jgi:hypothetical protein